MMEAFKDEEQEFLREISTFNGEFSLCGSTEATRQTHAEVLGLDMEVDAFYKGYYTLHIMHSFLRTIIFFPQDVQ